VVSRRVAVVGPEENPTAGALNYSPWEK